MSESARPVVLLVDDEPLVRRAFARAIERAGAVVVEAGDGEEALRRLEATGEGDGVRLVVTDYRMPGLGGEALLERLLALPGRPPILLLSGGLAGSDADAPAAMRVEARLQKPVSLEQLVTTVRELLQHTR